MRLLIRILYYTTGKLDPSLRAVRASSARVLFSLSTTQLYITVAYGKTVNAARGFEKKSIFITLPLPQFRKDSTDKFSISVCSWWNSTRLLELYMPI